MTIIAFCLLQCLLNDTWIQITGEDEKQDVNCVQQGEDLELKNLDFLSHYKSFT